MTKTDYAMLILGLFILGYVSFVEVVAPATFQCVAVLGNDCNTAEMAREVHAAMQIVHHLL